MHGMSWNLAIINGREFDLRATNLHTTKQLLEGTIDRSKAPRDQVVLPSPFRYNIALPSVSILQLPFSFSSLVPFAPAPLESTTLAGLALGVHLFPFLIPLL